MLSYLIKLKRKKKIFSEKLLLNKTNEERTRLGKTEIKKKKQNIYIIKLTAVVVQPKMS